MNTLKRVATKTNGNKGWYKNMRNKNKKRFYALRERRENARWHFWAYIMEHYPRLYKWADKYLPFCTLPF